MLVFKPCENFLLLLLLPPKINSTNSKPHHHHHHHHHVKLHFPPLKAHSKSTISSPPLKARSKSTLSSPPLKAHSSSFTADFLMDSGGLSSAQALHVIQQLPNLLKDRGRKPRLVISYFESIGFSKTHISKIISIYPRLMLANVNKTLKPKIQLFQDFGFSESDIADLIASRPAILRISLKNTIKPGLDLIKRFVKTEDLIKSIKRHTIYLIFNNNRKSVELNIETLRQYGVPDSEIVHMIVSNLHALMSPPPEAFKRNLERIESLGFKHETRTRLFSTAVGVMCRMTEATWDSKIDLLKGLGWSQVQILDAFRRQPKLLTLSSENLKEGIEFFKENLNWDALFLSRYPTILAFSMTRVIRRYEVLKCLMSKEIIKEEDNKIFISMVKVTETVFLSKYVFKYHDQLPYLYEIYKNQFKLVGCEEDNADFDGDD